MILSWLFSLFNPLKRILDTVDNSVDQETERLNIKSNIISTYVNAQVQVLTGRGWWFPILFIIPTAVHYGAVNLYSVFLCKTCILPQTWTIAALPSPFDQWEGVIISSMFIMKGGESIIRTWRK